MLAARVVFLLTGAFLHSTTNFHHLKTIIKQLNPINNYETVSIFVCWELFNEIDNLFPLLESYEESSMKPKIIYDQNGTVNLRHVLEGSPLSIVIVTLENLSILNSSSMALRGVRHNPVIFLFMNTPNYQKKIRILTMFCPWSWKQQFINSLVMFQDSSETYGCDPFPESTYVNQTDWPTEKLMKVSSKLSRMNLKKKVLDVPYMDDKPRIFTTEQNGNKSSKISGICFKLFEAFVEYNNGTLRTHYIEKDRDHFRSIDVVKDFLYNKSIELTPMVYADIDYSRLGSSYPLKLVDVCLVVPIKNEIPRFKYLIRPFKSEVWILFITSIFVTGFGIYLLYGKKDLSLAFMDSFCNSLYLDYSGFLLHNDNLTKVSIYILLRIVGFIISNYYNALMSSFLATTIFGDQLNTFQDLQKNKLNIMVRESEFEQLLEAKDIGNNKLPNYFINLLIVKRGEEVSRHRNGLNNSFGYVATTERWEYLNLQQEFANKKVFRWTKMCFGQYLLSYPMWFDSLYKDPINHFTLRVQSAGLYSHWRHNSFIDAVRHKELKIEFHSNKIFRPMGFNFFTYGWISLVVGLGLASSLFLGELYYSKYYFK